jgi:gamma-glutamyltranspeptidase/glutathione hydrolase
VDATIVEELAAHSRSGVVASADRRATAAGLRALRMGGNAVDAAIAANAVLAVTGPHLCGLGGDLFALVHDGTRVHALNASGRSGAGSDPESMRREGHRVMPMRHDVRSVTVPGCIDGWSELHRRFSRLPLAVLLEPAIQAAEIGAEASPLLVASVKLLDDRGRSQLRELAVEATGRSAVVRRPGVGRVLRAFRDGGRDACYGGEFGHGLLELGGGHFVPDDLARSSAEWVEPLLVDLAGEQLATIPPNSQGYLLLASALLAEHWCPAGDLDDPAVAHALIECAKAVGHQRPAFLHEHADPAEVLADARRGRPSIDPHRAAFWTVPSAAGDTTYLCAVDAAGMGVSLIQSNASGFGSWLVEPRTGINLHNRGLGFSLEPGHPAELGPGRRPPHTLSPALVSRSDGSLHAVLGTMGGDAQPQILLQVLTGLLSCRLDPTTAVNSPRWVLQAGASGFDTWSGPAEPTVVLESAAPPGLAEALVARGHRVTESPIGSTFGHAQAIVLAADGVASAGSDHRALIGAAGAV